MERLEKIDGTNWQEFVNAPLSVLMLARGGCSACAQWTEELTAQLEQEGAFPGVRFGKMYLDKPGLIAFKKANLWLASIDGLPYNIIYRGGERAETFLGGDLRRLAALLGGEPG